jgi:hypothetical protein
MCIDNNIFHHKKITMFEKRGNGGVNLRKKQSSSLLGDDDDLMLPSFDYDSPENKGKDKKKPRVLPFSQINWEPYMRSGSSAVIFWLAVTFSVLFFFAEEPAAPQALHGHGGPVLHTPNTENHNHHPPTTTTTTSKTPDDIIFFVGNQMMDSTGDETAARINRHQGDRFFENLFKLESRRRLTPNFGGLKLSPRENFKSSVAISLGDYQKYEDLRSNLLDEIDKKLSDRYYPLSDMEDKKQQCRPPTWTGSVFTNCNQVHELVTERPYDEDQSQGFEVFYLK